MNVMKIEKYPNVSLYCHNHYIEVFPLATTGQYSNHCTTDPGEPKWHSEKKKNLFSVLATFGGPLAALYLRSVIAFFMFYFPIETGTVPTVLYSLKPPFFEFLIRETNKYPKNDQNQILLIPNHPMKILDVRSRVRL